MTEAALRQALDLLALRVTSNRGGYPGHQPVPSDPDAIRNLAASLEARLAAAPSLSGPIAPPIPTSRDKTSTTYPRQPLPER